MTTQEAADVLQILDKDALICQEHDALRMGIELLELLAWIQKDSLSLLFAFNRWVVLANANRYSERELGWGITPIEALRDARGRS